MADRNESKPEQQGQQSSQSSNSSQPSQSSGAGFDHWAAYKPQPKF